MVKRILFIGFWGGIGLGLLCLGVSLLTSQIISWKESGVWNTAELHVLVDTNLQQIKNGERPQHPFLLQFAEWFHEPQRFHAFHQFLVGLLVWPYLPYVSIAIGGLFILQNFTGSKKIKEKHYNALINYYLYNARQLYEAGTALIHPHKQLARGTGTFHKGITYCANVALKEKESTSAVLKFDVTLTNVDATTVFSDNIDISIPKKAIYKRFRLCYPFESHGVDFPEMYIVIAPISQEIMVVLIGPKHYMSP
ncbi:MAG: hypothetical protein GKS05_00230 [Nitrospirales bacterium]|nr:hypothetical protein [Nitrospirales bacterium]